MGLLKILFVFSIVAFLFAEVIRIPIFGFEARLLDIVVCVLFISWLGYCAFLGKISKAFYVPSLLFMISGFASLVLNFGQLNSDQFIKSFSYLLRWAAFSTLLPIVLEFDKPFKNRIKQFLVFAGGFIVVAGYIQYIFYNNLKNLFYLGWDEHLYRMFSVFLDPNFAGAFYVLYLLFLINEAMGVKEEKLKLSLYGLSGIATSLAVLLTFSRSAFIMLVVGIGVFLILKKKIRLFLGLVVGLTILTLFLPRSYQTEGTNFFRTVSSEARIASAEKAVEIFMTSPIYGVGFNAYQFAKERGGYRTINTQLSHADASTDNSFLFVLATTGFIGLAIFLNLWYRILMHSRNSALILASVIALFINSLFINSLFYAPILFWIWVIIGTKESK